MEDYELIFKKFLRTLKELEEGDFWQLQQVLVEDMMLYGLDPSIACIEFFFRPHEVEKSDKPLGGIPHYNEHDSFRFAITWILKEARTRQFLKENGSDPKWAASIMLCDKELFDKVYLGQIESDEDFKSELSEIAELTYLNSECETLLLAGEQLELSTRIEQAARASFAESARKQQKSGTLWPFSSEETAEEQNE